MNAVTEDKTTRAAQMDLAVSFRHPVKADGERIWRLIGSCSPLDENSLYCNLLQCTHFSKTCMVAEHAGVIVGWVSGYRPPDEPETLFVWQVAIDASARGKGVGKALIQALLAAEGARGARRLKTTITPSNKSSWAMFGSVADALGAPLSYEEWFSGEVDFGGRCEAESLVTIGPF